MLFRSERALIEEVLIDKLQSLDRLLEVDPSIGQTRFHWLRSAPEAPGASNLVGLTERIAFLRTLEIDPRLQSRISSGRWDQMIREGNATPAWLANDFNELCGKVGDGVNQAADLISATASIPSLNFIPLTTFGNWF